MGSFSSQELSSTSSRGGRQSHAWQAQRGRQAMGLAGADLQQKLRHSRMGVGIEHGAKLSPGDDVLGGAGTSQGGGHATGPELQVGQGKGRRV